MTSERLAQIRQSIDHNPRGADGYVDELLRAVGQYIRDSHALRGALTDAEHERDEARAECKSLQETCDRLRVTYAEQQKLIARMVANNEKSWSECHDGSEQACCKAHD